MNAADHGLKRHAAAGVCLRIEEDLRVADALAGRPVEIRPGQVVEVLFLEQYPTARVVDVEEGLKIAEDVGAANVVHRGVREPDTIAPCQLEHELRLERPFDVQMEF